MSTKQRSHPLTEMMAELIATHLHGTYHCMRVWDAWRVGTMSDDDFVPVEESNTPHEIADDLASKFVPIGWRWRWSDSDAWHNCTDVQADALKRNAAVGQLVWQQVFAFTQ